MKTLLMPEFLRCLLVSLTILVMIGCRDTSDSTVSKADDVKKIGINTSSTTGDDADALFRAAVKLHLGDGVQPNFEEAARLYERATSAGHLGATKNLAALYYDGKGVRLDHKKAFELYSLAAKSGDLGALTSLAGMYLDGKGVAQDYGQALILYRQAADKNYSYAQTSVGLMYKFGWSVPKDLVEAAAWWLLASENGDGLAKENLARMRNELSSDAYAKAEARMVEIRNGILSNSKGAK